MVSIIIPYKNAGEYIAECIESIIKQTYKNWEAIMVNDNSIDNSNAIVVRYCNQDHRVKYFNSKGNGIIDALKEGFSNSSGNYITRMDADDIMTIDKINLLRSTLLKSGKNNVSVGLVKYFSTNKDLGEGYIKYAKWLNQLTKQQNNFSEIFKECTIPSPCWMMYRDDFIKIGEFNQKTYPEDYDLAFRMYINNIKISKVNKVIHYWRDHNLRTSRNDSKYDYKNFIPLKIKYLNYEIKNQQLILWGTGKKGKNIAKELIEREISFKWITDNANKHNKVIYGLTIQNTDILDKKFHKKIICGVSSKDFSPSPKNKFNDFISFY